MVDIPRIRDALRSHAEVSDETFDRIYPMTHRHRSRVHWTPIDVALQVNRLFEGAPGGRILDIGSGVGKMCIVGALSGAAHWSGVERSARSVRIAERVAEKLGVTARTAFITDEALAIDWSRFGGIYMFNPFAEAVFVEASVDPALRQAAFIYEVLKTEMKLATLEVGTHVVTYYGFGGEIPPGFELITSIRTYGDCVELWIRTAIKTA